MKKHTAAAAAVLFCLFPAALSAQLFNGNMSQAELQRIANGEIVIRNIGKAKNIGLNPVNDTAKRAIDTIKELDPSYLAEVIQIRPYHGNESIFDTLKPLLTDVESYVGIPYYSERHQRYYDLYSSVVVKSVSETENRTAMNAALEMDPFGIIDTAITIDTAPESLYYVTTNLNKLKAFDKYTCAKEEKMKSVIAVFRFDDFIVLYGIGGVDAPNIFFLKDRIDTSFINRIKTFCNYIFSNL